MEATSIAPNPRQPEEKKGERHDVKKGNSKKRVYDQGRWIAQNRTQELHSSGNFLVARKGKGVERCQRQARKSKRNEKKENSTQHLIYPRYTQHF